MDVRESRTLFPATGKAAYLNLRLAVHFYNHEDDIEQLTAALTELRP